MDVAELVNGKEVEPAVAGDGLGQVQVVGCFGELVGELGAGDVPDPVPVLGRGDARADQQVGLPGPGRDGDRLQQLRSVLPCEVRVVSVAHPLFGEVLAASAFRRFQGVVLLVVVLPDGSPGTIRVDATNAWMEEEPAGDPSGWVLSSAVIRDLRQLVAALTPLPKRRRRPRKDT